MGLVYVRGVLCVGTVLLFGTGLISLSPAVVVLTRWGWPSYCLARVTLVNLGYVTRGLGLVAVCFFVLLVPFPVSMITGMCCCVRTRICRFLWLISSFLERAAEVLDGVDPRWCAVQ